MLIGEGSRVCCLRVCGYPQSKACTLPARSSFCHVRYCCPQYPDFFGLWSYACHGLEHEISYTHRAFTLEALLCLRNIPPITLLG
jgi:hypothetical protein